MKRIIILITLLTLLVQPALGLIPVVQAQGPVGEGEPEPGGMPGYPAPDKPIPHHEPGQPSRAGSYRTQVVRENELGVQEAIEISGVDALAADGVDPLAGNYTLVNWDKILMSQYGPSNNFSLQTFEFFTPTLSVIPDSQLSIGNFSSNDSTAGDLNGDGQAEQIAAWISDTNHIYMSIGEMPGSARTTSAPAAVVHSSGKMDLLVRGYDDALWHRHSDDGNSWGDWNNLAGGLLLSGPAIASNGDGQFNAFVIGVNNQVYERHWNGTGWDGPDWQPVEPVGAWTPLNSWQGPTPELPVPAVVARGNQLDLFRLGPDNTLRWQHSDDGHTWQAWQNLGGMLASGPGAISLGPDHLQVFARGVDEALWHRTYNGAAWDPWQRLRLPEGVTLASAPTAVSPGSGQIRVFFRGSDNALWRYNGTDWESLGGELASGVGAVWLNDHYELFAQKSDGRLQYSNNGGSSWTDWTRLPPEAYRGDTQLVSAGPTSWVDVETGYFKGDTRAQIVLVYEAPSNQISIELFEIGERFIWNEKAAIASFEGSNPRITTGDFNGDGTDEIGVVYVTDSRRSKYRVKIFDATYTAGNWESIKLKESVELAASNWESWSQFDGTLNIASGDFDGDAKDEIAVSSDWNDQSTDYCSANPSPYGTFIYTAYFDIFDLTDNLNHYRTDHFAQEARRHAGSGVTGFALGTGDVDGDGFDEIIRTWPTGFRNVVKECGVWEPFGCPYGSSYHCRVDWPWLNRELQVLDWAGQGKSVNLAAPRISNYAVPGDTTRTALDTLAVGDLNLDLTDEAAFFRQDGSRNLLEVFEYTPVTTTTGTISHESEIVDPISGSLSQSPSLVAAPIAYDSIRVGPPSYRVQNRVDTLVAHINMPPKHRDLVKNAEGDYQLIESPEGECSPSPDSPDCTHAKYATLDFQSSEQTIQTVHDYAISAGVEQKTCVGGGIGGLGSGEACVQASIDATHGGNFQKSTETIESIGFRRKVIAANDDKVVYFGTPYGVWEYPVLSGAAGETSEDLFITVAFPLISITQYPDTSGGYYSGTCDETWYSAGHQPDNVWSYDPIGDVAFEDYDSRFELVYDAIEGDWAEGEIAYEDLKKEFESVSFKHSISARVGVETKGEANLGIVNVSSNFKAYVQGDYANTSLDTDTVTNKQETTFSYFFAPQPDSSKFTTRVIFYKAKDNSLVLNYQAEPGRAASWQLYNKPDPAFILPWYGFPDPDNPQVPPCGEDQKLFSPDIVINPSHTSLGKTVTISATVRNFSGEPARNVLVRFYQGDPANDKFIGERTIPFLSRESGPETVSIPWITTGVGRQKIYAVIDRYDTLPEMHDEDDLVNNNMAYGLVQLAATAFADMGLVEEQPPYDAISYDMGNPKPTVSLYVPRAGLDAVARFEVGGTEIGLPVEGRVFEVAAYQGSKYKMWGDSIANFNLKPEANDPPAVIIIAYTQADISTLAENDLKLYRLVGTNWTEATCHPYKIHRFPAEDLIAVPICQTGIFAFSDVAPGPIVTPMAQFSATPLSGTAPLTVTFIDLSSNFPTSWSWDFGDGTTSTAQNPSHTYLEPGTYEVSLTVSNEAGSNTHTKPSYINAYGMHADFMVTPVIGSAPLTVTFTDLSAGIGISDPTSWAWDFGDVTTSTEQNPTHTYSQNGAYTVTLTVNNGDAFDTKVDQNCVTVADVTPTYLPLIFKQQAE